MEQLGVDTIPVAITALYAGLLTVIVIVLGAMVGVHRARTGISILHGDDMVLAAKIRRHANFVESVPLALLLMALIELNGADAMLLHGLGMALIIARIAHPIGLDPERAANPLRGLGAALTTLVLAIAAGVAVYQYLGSL